VTTGWRTAARVFLAIMGVSVIVVLVRAAGTERVLAVLWQARAWLPVIVTLELMQALSDVLALRVLLGARTARITTPTWVRSSALAYSMMVLVPAGRAAGEVARVALLSRHVGAATAARASTQLQSAYVLAIGSLSAIEGAVVASRLGVRSPLALLLAGNALVMATLAAGLVAILLNARVGRWLDRLRRRIAASHGGRGPEHPTPASEPEPDDPSTQRRGLPWKAAAVCLVGRTIQLVQYGAILRAVGGVATFGGAFAAHGIELVGATVGDVVPNQLGVVDSAFRAFASEVGFADAPARALSIAFLARIARLLGAAASLVILATARPEGGKSRDRH
jgi:Lysylphosphatidylglycerol synthase TM region